MFEINDNGIVSYKIFKNKKTLENEISFDNYVGCEIAKMRGNNRYGTTYRVIVRGNDDKIVIGTKRRFDMHDAELIKSSIEDFVANKFLV
jgi:hypothetical protein